MAEGLLQVVDHLLVHRQGHGAQDQAHGAQRCSGLAQHGHTSLSFRPGDCWRSGSRGGGSGWCLYKKQGFFMVWWFGMVSTRNQGKPNPQNPNQQADKQPESASLAKERGTRFKFQTSLTKGTEKQFLFYLGTADPGKKRACPGHSHFCTLLPGHPRCGASILALFFP